MQSGHKVGDLVALRTDRVGRRASSAPTSAPVVPKAEPPLRIVMFIPYDLEYQPFAIRTIRFAEELVRRKHQVTVFYLPWPRKQATRIHQALPAGCDIRKLEQTPSGWRAASEAVAACDVVHFQKSFPQVTVPALALAKLHGKPLHQDWDDYMFWFCVQAARDALSDDSGSLVHRAARLARAVGGGALTGASEWLIPRMVDTLGAASAELRRSGLARGADPGAIFAASVGVDADLFHPDKRDEALRASLGLIGPTVLFSGNFDLHPELVFFTEALRHLVALVPEAQCLVVGGGSGRERLARAIAAQGLSRSVVMTPGLVPFAEMPRYVASADIGALPFRDTPVNRCKSSLTLLECMASGIPVVSHDVGDVAFMMGEAGERAQLGDPRDFAEKLGALARDPARRKELGQRGRTRAVEHFSWARSADHLERAYRAAIVRHGARKQAGACA